MYDASSNDWRSVDLNIYLNETYYNGLNSTAKGQIVLHNFSVGAQPYNDQKYSDLTDGINAENEQVGNAKVGLVTASEYLRVNSNTNDCRIISLVNSNYSTCKNTNWMFNSARWWTISAASSTNLVFHVNA